MIAHLTGTVAALAPDAAVIDVGGVGLQVQCAPGTLAGLRPGPGPDQPAPRARATGL